MRILVIDDSVSTCKIMVNLLKKMGYSSTDWAVTGEDGLRKALDCHRCPEVIFLDIMMSGMSGLDILSRLKAANYKGRIFMLTGIDDPHSRAFCIKEGAKDYLVKTEIDIQILDMCIRGKK